MNILIALAAFAALTFVAIGLLDYQPPNWVFVPVYLLIYFVVTRIRKRRSPEQDEPDPDYSHLPTSGPIGRFGQRGLVIVWLTSQLLCILNPFQLLQVAKQAIGNSKLQTREKKTGDDGTNYRTKATYSLPFAGEWLLYNGGRTRKTSHSWDVLGQRFAMDFVQADAAHNRHRGRGTRVEDYYCHGQPILSAAVGTVTKVEDRIGVAPFVGWGVCDFTARSFIGNHVIIRHADNEFGLYAHLIKNTVAVAEGQHVVQGQIIGHCGHSGHSAEPHLHFHLQDSADFYNGMGLPVLFTSVVVDGEERADAYLTAGNRVANTAPADSLIDPVAARQTS